MATHGDDLGNDLLVRPLHAKDLGKLLEVLSAGFSDAEDSITQPRHAEGGKLLVEEFNTQLRCKEREMFNDCQSHTPLLVLGQLHNGREKRLRE